MTPLTTLFKLSWNDFKLLVNTLLLMIKVRLMLWVMPFSRIQKLYSNVTISGDKDITICRISWSLKIVAHYMPGTTCLANALAGYSLLSKHGYSGIIKIGVGKSDEGEFEAHAWLEYGKRVVIGESEKEYMPLLDFKTKK